MKNKKYEILEHTADIRVVAYGRTLKELFQNSALSLSDVLSPKISFLRKILPLWCKRKVEVSAQDKEMLLVDFLSEVNFLAEKNKEVYLKIDIQEIKDTYIKAFLYGKKVIRFKLQVKGVTFYGLKIKKEGDFYKAYFTFDI